MIPMNDPFWKRSGFWSSLIASVPLAFAIFDKNVTQELVISVLGAWAGFFTVASARPTQRGE